MHNGPLHKREAMSTFEAVKKHICQECDEGGDCGWNCVESATCSIRCQHCGERNWWTGDLPDRRIHGAWVFNCVACGRETAYRRAVR